MHRKFCENSKGKCYVGKNYRWNVKINEVVKRTDSFCSGQGSVLGPCALSHELLSFINGGEFEQLSDYQCIKKDCALWSHFYSQCCICTSIILEVNTRLKYVC